MYQAPKITLVAAKIATILLALKLPIIVKIRQQATSSR